MTADPRDAPWVADVGRLFRSIREAAAETDLVAEAGHAPECRSCPLCRAIAVLRDTGPELLDQLAATASGLAEALRAATADPPADPPADPAEPPPPDPPPVADVRGTRWVEVTD